MAGGDATGAGTAAGRTAGAIGGGAARRGEPGAGRTPVAGAGSAGSSSRTLRAPWAEPSEAVRRPTDCSTRSVSSLAPTAKARGGLPSTAISARP